MSRRDITQAVTRAATIWAAKRGYGVFVEIGLTVWGARRADIMGLRMNGEVILMEVKSGRADFTGDTKWRSYLQYCDRLYICFYHTEKPWVSELYPMFKELGVGIGYLDANGYFTIDLRSKVRPMDGKIRRSIITRMAYRCATHTKRNTRKVRIFP